MTDNKSADPIVRRVGVFLGASVSNIDLSKPVPESAAAILKQAHAEHGVLVFPDQQISSDDLKRFGRLFGDLTVHPFSTSTEESPELIVYDNKEGNPPSADGYLAYGRDVPRVPTNGDRALLKNHPRARR